MKEETDVYYNNLIGMGKHYLINIVGSDNVLGFNAVVKPRKDIEKTLLRNG